MFRTATTKHAKQMTNLTLWQKVKIFIKFKKPAKKIPVHKKDAFFGLMERDTFDKIRDFGLFCLEMFKVFMATLLSLFVPQLCGPTTEDPTKHVCSIDENTRDLSPWNTFVLAFNFCTLGFALLHYLIVWKREQLFIDYLDEDDDFPDNHLPRVLELSPEIKHDLHLINWTVFVSSIFVMMLFVVNMIVSGVLVFRDYYHSFQTVTVYLTNTALIITVIEKTLFHAWAGIQHKVALSCFVFEPISFNVIDAEYVDRDLEARHFGPDLLKKKSSVAGDIPTDHNSGGLADVHLHDEHPAAQAPVLASSQQRSDDNITVHVDPSGHPDLPPTH